MLNPKTIITDFKKASISAVTTVFPQAALRGRRFHQWLRVISCTFKCGVLLSSTKHFLLAGCGNRHPRRPTFLWRHFHSHGQFARTGERSPHFCDACTLITARDICPEKSTCSVYHTDFVLFEGFTEPVMTYRNFYHIFHRLSFILFLDLDFGLLLFYMHMCGFVTTCLYALSYNYFVRFRV